ncbi:MAG: alpha-galactosidase [Gammaproteobacteria bacterium]|nr:alpha-galactosidase [Gammaproteobacteria bacterium]
MNDACGVWPSERFIRPGLRVGSRPASPWIALLASLFVASGAHALEPSLSVSVNARGDYAIGAAGGRAAALVAGVAAEVDGRWLRAHDYPRCALARHAGAGELGAATVWTVNCTGRAGVPDLAYRLRVYDAAPFADLEARVVNTTRKPVEVRSIRVVDAAPGSIADLGGPAAADRVLSDSFSEDRPAMQIRELGDPVHGMHRAVGSQLIYNRDSRRSLFIGALTSERFLTILRLHVAGSAAAPRITGYAVDSTGTTEMEEENSLADAPPRDRIALSLRVAPGASLASERVLIAIGGDYHRALETYGSLVRRIHHARVDAPPLMGWWSWTAYYFGLNDGSALTNARWEAAHLRRYGYDVFHIDEGYQYARGEYSTPNATLFPNGLAPLEYQVRGLGLTPGIWTAPFEVSERSSIYAEHQDWLVKNAAGEPIRAGSVVDGKDALYMLDTTNPGAQAYLSETYRRLVRDWGIHYIKLDFMDDSAIEGYRHRPETSALEAQRIGLEVIRKAVGEHVYLDKDGSAMLNPVGLVDYGRISQDTGHSFEASRDAAPGIAARYYMNRNFFVADPDAFTVSTQRITDQTWHEGKQALSLDAAEVSIALAAVSGGMLEIGDNLPSLEGSPERIALLENPDLITMVKLGRASVPLDLMSYRPEDRQPSVFFLRESPRQSVLTVFDWTGHPSSRRITLAALGLSAGGRYAYTDVFDPGRQIAAAGGALTIDVPARAVRVIKIVDRGASAPALSVAADCAAGGRSGEPIECRARANGAEPVLDYRWDFGDGVAARGATPWHTWTEPGDYRVRLRASALDGRSAEATLRVKITGYVSTTFQPADIRRLPER